MTTSPLKVEDSRAQFEAWHNSTHRWKIVPSMRIDDGYTNNIQASNGWAVWQASRAAIAVELPRREPDNGTDAQVDINAGFANRMLDKCAKTLCAAGITVKGDSDEANANAS